LYVTVKSKAALVYDIKVYGGVKVQIHPFLNSVLYREISDDPQPSVPVVLKKASTVPSAK
jgi:hypothetical protein